MARQFKSVNNKKKNVKYNHNKLNAKTHFEIVEKAPLPAVHIVAHQPHESLDLVGRDVFVEQLLVVVEEGRDGVFR